LLASTPESRNAIVGPGVPAACGHADASCVTSGQIWTFEKSPEAVVFTSGVITPVDFFCARATSCAPETVAARPLIDRNFRYTPRATPGLSFCACERSELRSSDLEPFDPWTITLKSAVGFASACA